MSTTWVPDLDAPLTDGCRVRIGDGPHEGTWGPYSATCDPNYSGVVRTDHGSIFVPRGCPLTVLREVVLEREWQPGDVVRDSHPNAPRGRVFERMVVGRWLQTGGSGSVRDDALVRPLTLLVPAEDQR